MSASEFIAQDGLLLVDKPSGITSFDIIRRLRRVTGIKKIGHAGTLDPAATGLMLILLGKATKKAAILANLDKTYQAELTLGAVSTTGDSEGELTSIADRKPPLTEIREVLKKFEGTIAQTPPAYSAIKIGGVRAYKMARRGQEVVMPSRKVVIHYLSLNTYDYPTLALTASVSSGTYIRSLAQDIGKKLGVGAYLSALRRTQVGGYSLDRAVALDQITGDNVNNYLIKLSDS